MFSFSCNFPRVLKVDNFLFPFLQVVYFCFFDLGNAGDYLACALFKSESLGKIIMCAGGVPLAKQVRYMNVQHSGGTWNLEWTILPTDLPSDVK